MKSTSMPVQTQPIWKTLNRFRYIFVSSSQHIIYKKKKIFSYSLSGVRLNCAQCRKYVENQALLKAYIVT